MIKQSDKILAEELVKQGLIAQADIDTYIVKAQSHDQPLRSYLVNNKLVSEQQVLNALSIGLKLEAVDLKNLDIDKSVLEQVPVKFAGYYKFLPIKIENKTLTIVSASSLDVKIQDEIRVHLGLEPKIVLARESDVLEALKKYYGVAAETIDRILTKEPTGDKLSEDDIWVEDLEKESQDASVSKLVNQIILDAYQKRATDIHIEPYRDIVRLRYRIDGVLVDANLPPEAKQFLRPILSRIKIMANLSIEEKRLPQDGSAVVKTKDQDLDLRISTIPTPRGESIVVRILRTKVILYSLDKLGIERKNIKILKDLIKRPHGIVLVTGPTGSGKTTTLYACLNEINNMEKKIITIEDPVEYEMEGITQIQVNSKVNLDFARGLRSVLRHDPDIIMVGEVRDIETAEIAIRTALTGHLVFSTLHTNDSASGITRLIDMGLEPFLVASSIQAFVAQRLVRVICPQCKIQVKNPRLELKEEIASALKLKKNNEIKIFRGTGCDRCNNTGYYGRTAIYEILLINEAIREAILEKRRTDDIKQLAIANGMRTLRQDGWHKVLEGITTPEEVMEATVRDQVVDDKPAAPNATPNKANAPANQKKGVLDAENQYDSRVFPRVMHETVVRFEIITVNENNPSEFTSEGVEHTTYTKDISAGGVRFILGHTIPVGTVLALKVQLMENERSVNCMAKVCRVEEDNVVDRFNIIAFYLDISSADRAKITQFVETLIKNKNRIKSENKK